MNDRNYALNVSFSVHLGVSTAAILGLAVVSHVTKIYVTVLGTNKFAASVSFE
jgi:hypothetical protein